MPAPQQSSLDPAASRTGPVAAARLVDAVLGRLRRTRSGDSARDRQSRRLSVLLVEDDAVNQTLTRALLEQDGHRVTLAVNGREAIRHAGVGGVDVVLMDIRLPGQSGLAATRRIRALPESRHAAVPVVAMSGNLSPHQLAECRDAGMDLHLPKPVELDRLRDVLRQALALPPDRFSRPQPAAAPESRAPQEQMPEGQMLDRRALDGHLRVLGPARMAHIIDSFLKAAPDTLQAAAAGAAALDLEALSRAAHRLASGASTAGLPLVAALARATEQSADRGDAGAARASAAALEQAYRTALPLLLQYRAELPPG